MEIGKQIKKYRIAMKLSQDALAEKIFVSRHGNPTKSRVCTDLVLFFYAIRLRLGQRCLQSKTYISKSQIMFDY